MNQEVVIKTELNKLHKLISVKRKCYFSVAIGLLYIIMGSFGTRRHMQYNTQLVSGMQLKL